jgi:hypothetical protein
MTRWEAITALIAASWTAMDIILKLRERLAIGREAVIPVRAA